MESSTIESAKVDWVILHKFWFNTAMAATLAFLAGSFNSLSSISILFERSTHVSGRIADIGIGLVLMPISAFFMITIWAAFVFGSFIAGVLLPKIGLTKALIFQALYIFAAALIVASGVAAKDSSYMGPGKAVLAFVLPLAMGFQNSLTTQLPLERTTHWTGASTDLGIALSQKSFPLAIFIIIKILSFVLGAALMAFLVGILEIEPHWGLIFVASGLLLTTFIGDKINKSAIANSVG